MRGKKRWRLRLERLQNLHIKTKFFLAMFSVVMLSCALLGGAIYGIIRNLQLSQVREFAQEYLDQLSENMENKSDLLMDETYRFMSDRKLLQMLQEPAGQSNANVLVKNRQLVRTAGGVCFSSTSYVDALYLRSTYEDVYWWVRSSAAAGYADTGEAETRLLTQRAAAYMEEMDKKTLWFEEGGRVFLARRFVAAEDLKQDDGLAVFEIDPVIFQPVDGENWLIGNDDLAFQHKSSGFLYADASRYAMARSVLEPDGQTDGAENMDDYLMVQRTGAGLSWRTLCLIQKKDVLRGVTQIGLYTLLAIGVSVVVALVISLAVSKSMTQNINSLEKNMRNVEAGDFSARITPKGADEIGMLCRRFNYMADQIESLIAKAYEDAEEKQNLQMQVLKAQINPHFLYNSLGSIRCLARANREPEITQMVTALIELLRASLGKTSEYQTVAEEIRYIKNYFVLQQFRYEDSFVVEYDLDEAADDCVIINFLLQPLVENAIFHGLEISKGNGVIRITSKIVGDYLLLAVEDNGIGMSQERIRQILQTSNEKYAGLNSIGVSNTRERIQRYYGKAYGLHYISELGKGTTVEILLPVVHQKKQETEESKHVQSDDRGG